MLWSDHGRPTLRRAGQMAVFVALAAMTLAACTVQPLYGPAQGGGRVQSTMSRITIDPVDDRVAQVVRNKLIFSLTGGSAVSDPLYRMKLNVSTRQVGLGITTIESAPVYSINVTASYDIVKIETGASVLKGTARGSASYNRVNQVYANTRAKIDAENRAAEAAAMDLSTRVAAAVAKGL
jgi:LPS-assembly lipoprotein